MSPPRQRPSARDRLIAVAVERIRRDGMTVGLDHLSLEGVIADSGVSRATAYRHWPNKADFLREVLVETVRTTRLVGETPTDLADLTRLLQEAGDGLRTAQGRRDLVVEALRRTAQADVDRMRASPQWQTYLAITATCRGLPPGPLRDDVRAALAQAEAGFVEHRAQVYARLPGLLGYRLVAPLTAPEGFTIMASASGAMMTGLLVTAAAGPDPAPIRLAPFGSSRPADWTLPALHLVGVLLAHLEPDPDVVWDAARWRETKERLDEVLAALEAGRADETGGGSQRAHPLRP